MNKKLLIIILLTGALVLPSIALAAAPAPAAGGGNPVAQLEAAFVAIGASVVTIGWIIAGILYLTSAGSPEKMGTAKKAIAAAIIGTILIIISAAAAAFVGKYFTP